MKKDDRQSKNHNTTSLSSALAQSFDNKKLLYATLVIVAIAVGLVAYGVYQANDPVFTVGDEEFHEDDIANYIDLAAQFGVNREYALEGIEQAMIFKVTADEYGIEVSDEQIEAALRENTTYDPELIDVDNPWLRLVGERIALEKQIQDGRNQAAKGYSFVFNFGTLVDEFLNPEEGSPEEIGVEEEWFGDEELIARDREYARDRAEFFRQAISEGDLDPDEAVEQIVNDERLNVLYVVNDETQGTIEFGDNEEISLLNMVGRQQIAEFIASYSGDLNQPSEIQVGETGYRDPNQEGAYESFYYFVYLSEIDKQWYEMEETLNERGVQLEL